LRSAPGYYFPWAVVANWKWHIESHNPTQANRRLEWGTPAFVAGMAKKNMLHPLDSIVKRGFSRRLYSPMILIVLVMS
jgi:hypothetical protein